MLTASQAMDCGWMLQIPLQNRIGCCYVFDDRFIDFYIILKRENSQRIHIDGAIHSKDDYKTNKSYVFASECEGSIGLVEYFTVPVGKDGSLGKVARLGHYIAEEV